MEDTKELIKKYQIFILPIASVLIGLGLGVVVVQQALRIPDTNSEINQNKQTLSKVNQKIRDLEDLDADQFQQDLNITLTALPAEKDIPGVFDQLQNYLKLNGLVLESVNFSNQDVPVKDLTSYNVKVTVTGSRSSLTSFIAQLQEAPRVLKVDTLNAAAGQTGNSFEILVTLNAFFQPVPKSQNLPPDKPLVKPDQKNLATLDRIKGNNEKYKLLTIATGSGTPAPPAGKDDPFASR